MATSKIRAYFDEFSFLEKIIRPDAVRSIKVERVDEQLMDQMPRRWMDDWSEERWDIIKIFDRAGEELAEVGGLKKIRRSWYKPWTWSGFRRTYETVGEVVARFPAAQFIVMSRPAGYVESDVVIYKAPKHFTIGEWLEELPRREKAKLSSEVQKIDSI